MGRALTSLSKGLDNTFGVGLSGICGGDSVIAKLFRPHECVLCSYYGMPVELNTSVTAFDAHTSVASQEGRKPALSCYLSCRQIYLANQRQVRRQGI